MGRGIVEKLFNLSKNIIFNGKHELKTLVGVDCGFGKIKREICISFIYVYIFIFSLDIVFVSVVGCKQKLIISTRPFG